MNFSLAKNAKITPSLFEVISLNNPVTQSDAKFLLKAPSSFKIDKVFYVVSGPKLFNVKVGVPKEIQLIQSPQGPLLAISVNNWKNGFYQLRVIAQDKSKNRHEYKSTLRDYVSFVLNLPNKKVPQPDPKKNDSTLLGIDLDENGIRDDIQNYILNTYAGNTDLIIAMNKYASTIQANFENISDANLSIIATHEKLKAAECVWSVMVEQGSEIEKAMMETDQLKAISINTKIRIDAANKLSAYFSGQSHTLSKGIEACDY